MSLSLFRQRFYTRFSTRLRQLTDEAQSLSGLELSADATQSWMSALRALQQDFQGEIATTEDGMEGEASGRVRSIETEIFRVLKLLETDFLFLKSAKQPQTLRVRHQQFCDRLTAAASYSQAMLTIAESPDAPDSSTTASPGSVESAESAEPTESAKSAESGI